MIHLHLVQVALVDCGGAFASLANAVGALNHVTDAIALFLLDLYVVRLEDAVKANNRWLLEQLLQVHHPSGHRQPSKQELRRALSQAATQNNVEMTKRLFDFWSNFLPCRGRNHPWPLDDMYADLLHSDDQESASDNTCNPFDIACQEGHLELVQWYANARCNTNSYRGLRAACSHGRLPVVRSLCGQLLAEAREAFPGLLLHRPRPLLECWECLVELAALGGHVELAKWVDSFVQQHPQSTSTRENQDAITSSDSRTRCNCEHHLTSIDVFFKPNDPRRWKLICKGGLSVCKWLMDRMSGCHFVPSDFVHAAHKAHIDVIEWLYDHTKVTEQPDSDRIIYETYVIATKSNRMDAIEFLHSKDHTPSDVPSLFGCAIAAGYLEIAKYWEQKYGSKISCPPECVIDAAISGSRETVEYCDPDHRVVFPQHVAERCIHHSYDDVLRYLLDEKCRLRVEDEVRLLNCAIENGNLQSLRLLFDYFNQPDRIRSGSPIRPRLDLLMDGIRKAALSGYYDVIGFALEAFEALEPVKPDFTAVLWSAIDHRELLTVKLLRQKQMPGFSETALVRAATVGSLKIVKYLCEQGIEPTYEAMREAGRGGFLPIVQYLHELRAFSEHQAPTHVNLRAISGAASEGHLDTVRFLHEACGESLSSPGVEESVRNGHGHVLQYLFDHHEEARAILQEAFMTYGYGAVGRLLLREKRRQDTWSSNPLQSLNHW